MKVNCERKTGARKRNPRIPSVRCQNVPHSQRFSFGGQIISHFRILQIAMSTLRVRSRRDHFTSDGVQDLAAPLGRLFSAVCI